MPNPSVVTSSEPVRPDPEAAHIRTSCSRQLIVELAGRISMEDTSNPDRVLQAAIARLQKDDHA